MVTLPPVKEQERVAFDLIGTRSYVRATDVLAAMLARLPDQTLSLSFRHALTGPVILSSPPARRSSVLIRAGADSFGLSPDPAELPMRKPAAPVRVLHINLLGLHVFAFASGTSVASRIGRCFDLVHPHQPHHFTVRDLTLHAGHARRSQLLWFRIRITAEDSASLTLRTPFGRLADIGFRIRPKS